MKVISSWESFSMLTFSLNKLGGASITLIPFHYISERVSPRLY
jgi:hypothetical protein